jgi:hypothetical protein
MARTGGLEAEVERLAGRLADAGTQPSSAELAAVRGRDHGEPDASVSEIGQLRLQLTSVASQLAQTENELREVLGNRPRRRKPRQDHISWWRKTTRRLGLRRSKR